MTITQASGRCQGCPLWRGRCIVLDKPYHELPTHRYPASRLTVGCTPGADARTAAAALSGERP